MKVISAVLLAVMAMGVLSARSPLEETAVFNDWKGTFNRVYESAEHEAQAFKCFKETMDKVEEQANDANQMASFGYNKFADMCEEEFARIYLSSKPSGVNESLPMMEVDDSIVAASAVDWRTKGAVTRVKDQGHCGSCWSFSATGAMEGAHALKHGGLLALSEEELVQCDHYSNGCNGGNMYSAIKWVVENGGIDSEKDYPYTSGQGTNGYCNSKKKVYAAKFKAASRLPQDEKRIAAWVSQGGPVSIGVYAVPWKSYHGGIFTGSCSGPEDHGVLIVGYGTSGGVDYWIVKNSWSASWGEQGYIRLQRGVNKCSVRNSVTAAVAA